MSLPVWKKRRSTEATIATTFATAYIYYLLLLTMDGRKAKLYLHILSFLKRVHWAVGSFNPISRQSDDEDKSDMRSLLELFVFPICIPSEKSVAA